MPESRTFKNETESNDCAFRVIADHIRTLSFSIADGIIPSNEGRNYVLRRILRRAILFGRKLNLPAGFFTELSKTLVEQMGTAYPELIAQQSTIEKVIANEETAFNKTLERGLQLFEKMSEKGSITGEEAFTLYDTYGFPFDLTALIAEERKISIDKAGFDSSMNQQKERARSSQKKEVVLTAEDGKLAKTNFKGFDFSGETFSAEIISVERIDADTSAIVLDQTTFYGEMGGQVGDTGTITTEEGTVYSVIDTQVKNGIYLHLVNTQDALKGTVVLKIDLDRRQAIQRHHSATHLLNWALRSTLGTHIQQAGSYVSENRLRFDFSHFEAIDAKTLQAIEQSINEKVLENSSVETYEVAFKDKPEDVVAVFGEKYGDQVRVVDIGGFSKELCGGTHVEATGEIGLIKIISESGIAAGTRRIEAVCGATAYTLTEERFTQVDALTNKFNCSTEELANRVDALIDSKKQLEKELKRFHQKSLSEQVDKLAQGVEIIGDNVSYLHTLVAISDSSDLRSLGNQLLAKLDSGLVVLASSHNGKAQVCAALSQQAVEQGYNAGSIVKEICESLGGRGGGKANFAMGGAPANKSLEAIISGYSPKTA
jgi:alanyl-tRNA synthetase